MNTVPKDAWNTAFNDEDIKANMIFPIETPWTHFVKLIHKRGAPWSS